MDAPPVIDPAPDTVTGRFPNWLTAIRVVVLMFLFSLGGIYILFGLWGALMPGSFRPPPGVSYEEHMRRLDTNYYRFEALWMVAKMAGYLALVVLPHRWIVRSRVRFALVFTVLCIYFSLQPISLVSDLFSRLGSKTELLSRLSWLPFDVYVFFFYAIAPTSLYLSWKYGRKAV
jgi:hypothetical protein